MPLDKEDAEAVGKRLFDDVNLLRLEGGREAKGQGQQEDEAPGGQDERNQMRCQHAR